MLRRSALKGVFLLSTSGKPGFPTEASLTDAIERAVMRSLSEFLSAFNNLDWNRFLSHFSDDATIFHPDIAHPRRIDTSEQFEHAWRDVSSRSERVPDVTPAVHGPCTNRRTPKLSLSKDRAGNLSSDL